MKVSDLIRERVESYIRDYANWNNTYYSSDVPIKWEDAKRDFAVLSQRHFVAPIPGAGSGLSLRPAHSPETESIISVTDSSTVETAVKKRERSHYHEYALELVGSEWKIKSIKTFYESAEKAVNDGVDLKALGRKKPQIKIATAVPSGLLNLFEGPARLNTMQGIVNTKVVASGFIEAPSGYLAGGDPGTWQWGAEIFEIPIPPGKHQVEAVIDDQRKTVGAARILFGGSKDKGVVAPARRVGKSNKVGSNSDIIGVDGGIIGLADAGILLSLRHRDRQRLSGELGDASLKQSVAVVPLQGSINAVAISSGGGDGAYRAYWHLSDDHAPLSLIFDFVDMAQPVWETVRVPITAKNGDYIFDEETLTKQGVAIEFRKKRNKNVVAVRSRKTTKVRIVDSDRRLLFDSQNCNCSIGEVVATYELDQNVPGNFNGHLETEIYLGHKYDFVDDGSKIEK